MDILGYNQNEYGTRTITKERTQAFTEIDIDMK